MEAYHIDRFGSVDGVVLRSSEDLRPGPKEILMQVRATSLNYRDLMVLKGGGRGPTTFARVSGNDEDARRNRTFTPRLERGRASSFAGDSATAERSAGQHAHPHRAFRLVNQCVSVQS